MEQTVSQIIGWITKNVEVSVKRHHIYEKDYVCNPATCICEDGKIFSKYCRWLIDYQSWSYSVILWIDKNYSNKFCWKESNL